jgi:hypothetical protein
VEDPSWPQATGTYELEVSGGAARSARVATDPDLDMGADTLGAIYLGDTSVLQMVAAGRIVENRPGAAAEADRVFHWAPAAWGVDMW